MMKKVQYAALSRTCSSKSVKGKGFVALLLVMSSALQRVCAEQPVDDMASPVSAALAMPAAQLSATDRVVHLLNAALWGQLELNEFKQLLLRRPDAACDASADVAPRSCDVTWGASDLKAGFRYAKFDRYLYSNGDTRKSLSFQFDLAPGVCIGSKELWSRLAMPTRLAVVLSKMGGHISFGTPPLAMEDVMPGPLADRVNFIRKDRLEFDALVKLGEMYSNQKAFFKQIEEGVSVTVMAEMEDVKCGFSGFSLFFADKPLEKP